MAKKPVRIERFDDPKQLLTELADFFEEDPKRWAQGSEVNCKDRACIVTGMMELAGGNESAIDQWLNALGLFADTHGLIKKNDRAHWPLSRHVVRYNDANGRTVKQVIKALREAAR